MRAFINRLRCIFKLHRWTVEVNKGLGGATTTRKVCQTCGAIA